MRHKILYYRLAGSSTVIANVFPVGKITEKAVRKSSL